MKAMKAMKATKPMKAMKATKPMKAVKVHRWSKFWSTSFEGKHKAWTLEKIIHGKHWVHEEWVGSLLPVMKVMKAMKTMKGKK
jgi:hypothetical protein